MSPTAAAPRLVALDWGTTSLRAYLLGDGGIVLERRAEPLGILNVPERDFRAVFDRIVAEWRGSDPMLPSIASGMIGSAQGWIEAPYASLPADLGSVARSLAIVPTVGLRIVPGLAQRGRAPDVMRGEETQLFGAMAQSATLSSGGVAVLPGTHAKWARIAGGRVEGFTTYMTGELFAVLAHHSILGRLAGATGSDAAPGEAFARGVRHARDADGGLSSLIFSARSTVLVGELRAEDSLEYLSGVLIGDEVRAGLASGDRPRVLIGEPALCARYATALGEFGVVDVDSLGDTAAAGLWQIALHAFPELQRADGSSRRSVSA
ncbi:MAG: 2-keto-3-deoxy-galactonokinase [Gemmatimonadetes bacterium]|nr:MAG: 2-keto-3-deoxy-galactonokinase [Gemmatimonadota bacterium]